MSDDLNLDVYFPQFAQFLLRSDHAQAFTKLCAIGLWEQDEDCALEASLCKKFGVNKQSDWPLAPLALMSEDAEQASGYWFLVHPVHFVLQRDFFTLSDAVCLSVDESALLVMELNQHFSQDGLRFLPSEKANVLYLHVKDEVSVTTYLLSEAIGRDVGKYMPQGLHGMKFQSLLNEVQMLLHEHPINQVREQQGLSTLNSLWLSGGGSFNAINQPAQKPAFQLFANDALSAGLANWAGIDRTSTTDYASSTFKGDSVLVVPDNADLEGDWFAPLLQSLKKNKLSTLRCHFDVHGMTFTLHLKPIDAWKFWRKQKPVSTYFNLANSSAW